MRIIKAGKAIVLVLATLLAAAALAGCAGTTAGPAEVEFRDTEATYELKVGDTATVKLEENPSTGYAWELEMEGDNLEICGSEYCEPEKGALGAAGTHVWQFTAVEAGNGKLKFIYYREWEGKENTAETKEFKVTVK